MMKTAESNRTYPSWMTGTFGVVSAIVMIALGGILHGHYSNRWGQPDNMMEVGARLKQVPLSIGEWSSNGDIELSETTLTLLECMGYLNRVYVSKSTGESVSVALTFGPKGPIAVHTPEICYSSRSVTAGDKRKSIENDFDGNRNSLWELIFTSNDIEKSKLHVTYGWSDGGPWLAAENPRFWRTDYLYKIQTASGLGKGNVAATNRFLQDFLPEIRKIMKPSRE
jgi:hypothetical protein